MVKYSRAILAAVRNERSEASIKERPPSGKLTPLPMLVPVMSMSSSEPPPRSATTPSGAWKPEMTPSADSSASRRPDNKSTGAPIAAVASAMKAGPFDASRAAAVAIA